MVLTRPISDLTQDLQSNTTYDKVAMQFSYNLMNWCAFVGFQMVFMILYVFLNFYAQFR